MTTPQDHVLRTPPPVSRPPLSSEEANIDLRQVVITLWRYKLWLALLVVVAWITTWIGLALLPKKYYAVVTFRNITEKAGQNQLSSLAMLAGISFSNSGEAPTENIDILVQSRTFAERIIKELDLLPVIFAKQYDPITKTYKMEKPPTPTDGAGTLLGAVLLDHDKTTGLNTLTVKWNDPELAATIANYYVATLQKYMEENILTNSEKTLNFITQRLKITETELKQAEEQLKSFSERHKVFRMTDYASQLQGSLNTLNNEKTLAEVQRQVQEQFMRDTFEAKLTQARLRAVEQQMKILQGEMTESLATTSQSIRLQNLPELALEQGRIEREISVQQEIYKSLRLQWEQSKIQSAKESTMIKVVDSALVPTDPYSRPKLPIMLAVSLGVLILGGSAILAWDALKKHGFLK